MSTQRSYLLVYTQRPSLPFAWILTQPITVYGEESLFRLVRILTTKGGIVMVVFYSLQND